MLEHGYGASSGPTCCNSPLFAWQCIAVSACYSCSCLQVEYNSQVRLTIAKACLVDFTQYHESDRNGGTIDQPKMTSQAHALVQEAIRAEAEFSGRRAQAALAFSHETLGLICNMCQVKCSQTCFLRVQHANHAYTLDCAWMHKRRVFVTCRFSTAADFWANERKLGKTWHIAWFRQTFVAWHHVQPTRNLKRDCFPVVVVSMNMPVKNMGLWIIAVVTNTFAHMEQAPSPNFVGQKQILSHQQKALETITQSSSCSYLVNNRHRDSATCLIEMDHDLQDSRCTHHSYVCNATWHDLDDVLTEQSSAKTLQSDDLC